MNRLESMIQFFGLETLETPRLLLRPFVVEDAEAMLRWTGDPQVTRFMPWQAHQGVEDAQHRIERYLVGYEKETNCNWGIVYKENGALIGEIGGHPEAGATFEMGYDIAREYWGKGISTEAARMVLARAFQCGAHRVQASHDPDNAASGRVLEKCGMTYEGTLREYLHVHLLGFRDVRMYAILKEDWEKREMDRIEVS